MADGLGLTAGELARPTRGDSKPDYAAQAVRVGLSRGRKDLDGLLWGDSFPVKGSNSALLLLLKGGTVVGATAGGFLGWLRLDSKSPVGLISTAALLLLAVTGRVWRYPKHPHIPVLKGDFLKQWLLGPLLAIDSRGSGKRPSGSQ